MKKFLAKAAEIEATTAKIYHEFAKSSQCDARLSAIWEQMARDEEDHAQALKLAIRISGDESFSGLSGDLPNPDEMGVLLAEIFARAKAGKNTELEMLKDAVSLENKFRKFHVTYTLAFKDSKLLKTFEALARADDVHLNDLNEYLQEYKARQTS